MKDLRLLAVFSCFLKPLQAGFPPQHYSCQDPSNFSVAKSSSQFTILILLGFSTAYDTVDHLAPSEALLWYVGHHTLLVLCLPQWPLYSQSPLLDPSPSLPDFKHPCPPRFFSLYVLPRDLPPYISQLLTQHLQLEV